MEPTVTNLSSAASPSDTGLLIVVAAVVTVAIQALKRSGALSRVPSRWIPVVSLGLAITGTISASVTSGHSLTQSLVEGVLAGLSATGIYEMGKPKTSPEAAS
jgi:Na+-translocating ferredoxin:NAD+ oxidoreductase RnfA subunit